MTRLISLAAALFLAAFATAQELPPSSLIRAPEADQPIRLTSAVVKAEIAGTLATTRIELSFLNPNRRQLEGDLQFPLNDGQTVTGFALESFEGQMMPAMPVGKARGQEVFEAIERRGADPALLEQTQGKHFKLRIYPLLPGKPRRVALEISELLVPDHAGRVSYRLPLPLSGDTHLKLALRLTGVAADRIALDPALKGADLLNRHGDAWVLLEQARFHTRTPALSWVPSAQSSVFSDRFEGEDYFHAEIPNVVPPSPRPAVRELLLIWDASASGVTRDHDREFALLDAWFKAHPQVNVSLIVSRDVAEPPRRFDITQGHWQELHITLRQLAYDGASNAAAWSVPAASQADLALLFSDGLANWGDGHPGAARIPLYAINAAAAGNARLLRQLAESSAAGGQYLDLSKIDTAAALAELRQIRPRLQLDYSAGIGDATYVSVYPQQGRYRLAGRLTRPQAQLAYTLLLPDGRRDAQQLAIRAAPETGELVSAVAAKIWASYRIEQLEAEPQRHQAEIERLGHRFSLVSSRTSLLVLETLDDHLLYRVTPPPGPMRTAYLAQQSKEKPQSQSHHLDDLARRFAAIVKWWETDFPKDVPIKNEPTHIIYEAAVGQAGHASGERFAAPAAPAFMNARLAAAPAPVSADAAAPATQASIRLQKWQPDSAYGRRLRDASDNERYGIYLDERPGHLGSTAFFLDAADVFFDKGQIDLALRVLSNLAEMDLESRQILRILAYRLNQAGRADLALPLLRRVRDLAPEEPQTWRDLGLALAATGNHQTALDTLWETVARPWDSRFSDIDLTALAELNALLARHPELDAARIDPRFKRNLPLDLRAVLTWDTDNTDIDLWVIDPNGEKTYYRHPLSYQGGKLSRDFTAGYGPETYSLKTAKPGQYEVRAQFYGHQQQALSPYTTLMLQLTTGFGTPEQKAEAITLRLSGAREEVLVGRFEVVGTGKQVAPTATK